VVPIAVTNAVNAANLLYVSVTVCAPNSTTQCETIPNVQVDTGSTGLRILDSAFTANEVSAGAGAQLIAALPDVTNAGGVEAECAQFADGESWGVVHSASVEIAGLATTSAVSVQIIGDTAGANIPSACQNAGTLEDSQATLGANGIIGVGYFLQDCGTACSTTQLQSQFYSVPVYWTCPSASTCTGSGLPTSLQVSNPIASFPAGYNNGDVIELPSVPATGASSASGYMVFGVATQGNNALPTAVLGVDQNGFVSANFNGANLGQSFIDSGSSVYFFQDSSVAQCSSTSVAPGFYCPTPTFSSNLILTGNAAPMGSYSFSFSIGNAVTLFTTNTNSFAFNNLGAPLSATAITNNQTFDVGLPFFLGRSIFTVFEGATASTVTGPAAAIGVSS
jgi:hypothetical protein